MPRSSIHLHTEIYPNLKGISELFKMYMKSPILLYKLHGIIESSVTRDSAVSAFKEKVEFLERSLRYITAAWLAIIFF